MIRLTLCTLLLPLIVGAKVSLHFLNLQLKQAPPGHGSD